MRIYSLNFGRKYICVGFFVHFKRKDSMFARLVYARWALVLYRLVQIATHSRSHTQMTVLRLVWYRAVSGCEMFVGKTRSELANWYLK